MTLSKSNGEIALLQELMQTMTAKTKMSPNKMLNEQKNSFARALKFFIHFVTALFKTTT